MMSHATNDRPRGASGEWLTYAGASVDSGLLHVRSLAR
jgi:hypothetical protein